MAMKLTLILAGLLTTSLGATCAADPLDPQAAQIANMVKEIQAQQAQIVANQAKIEEKLTSVAEGVRVARIYSSRAGR